MPVVHYLKEEQVLNYFATETGLSRQAQNLPPLSSEQIRELWAAITPAEFVEWEGKALAALAERMTDLWRPKTRADYQRMQGTHKLPKLDEPE